MKSKIVFLFSTIVFISCNLQINQNQGEKILFMSKRDGNFEIYRMNDDGSNPVNLTNNQKTDFWASSYKDKIYFYSERTGNKQIFTMDFDGNNVINISNNNYNDRLPNISNDGKNLLFLSDRDEKNGELYLMNVETLETKRITNNNAFEDVAFFGKNNNEIVFTREVEKKENEPFNGEIFTKNLKTGKEKRLTNRMGYDGGAQYSPDFKKIAFYGKSEKGFYDIFIMNADGSELVNLTNDEEEDYSPSWSKDGKRIAFTSGNSKNYEVFVIDINTLQKVNLTNHPSRDESPFYILH